MARWARDEVVLIFIACIEENQALTARYLENPELRGAVSRRQMKQVYDRTRGESPAM